MKVTSLLTKEDAMLEQDVQQTSEIVSRYSHNWFGGRGKKAGEIIDAELVGIAKWKKILASWVLRIGRCIAVTDPGIWFIAVIGLMIGLIAGLGIFMDMNIHDKAPSFFAVVGHCLLMVVKCILLGWSLMYACWEIVQLWKWITKWSERIQKEEERSNAPYRR